MDSGTRELYIWSDNERYRTEHNRIFHKHIWTNFDGNNQKYNEKQGVNRWP